MIPPSIAAFLASTIGRLIMILLLIGIVFITIHSCTSSRQKTATARQSGKESEAFADSAADAVNTVVARGGAESDVDAIVEGAAAQMDAADTDAARRAAAMSALCQMKLYKEKPECAVTPSRP